MPKIQKRIKLKKSCPPNTVAGKEFKKNCLSSKTSSHSENKKRRGEKRIKMRGEKLSQSKRIMWVFNRSLLSPFRSHRQSRSSSSKNYAIFKGAGKQRDRERERERERERDREREREREIVMRCFVGEKSAKEREIKCVCWEIKRN